MMLRRTRWSALGGLLFTLTACGGDAFTEDPGTDAAGGSAGANAGGASGGGQAGQQGGSGGVSGGAGGAAAQGGAAGTGGAAATGGAGGAGQGGVGGDAQGGAGQGGDSQGGAGSGQGGAGTSQGGAGNGQGGAGNGQGGAGMAGAGGMTGGAGGVSPVDCAALYVSPMGNDNAQGCSTSPLRTIGKALSLAFDHSIVQINVCAGDFPEQLTIGSSVTIDGSLDCATWAPTLGETFDPDNEEAKVTTSVTNPGVSAAAPAQRATVSIAPGKQVTLRGLHIIGHKLADGPSVGIDATASGVMLTLERSVVGGGSGNGTNPQTFGSIGVDLNGDHAHLLHKSKVTGGSGTLSGNGVGSEGVLVRPAASGTSKQVTLDGVVIEGGSGVSDGDPVGKVGSNGSVAVASQASLIINDSTLRGGGGKVLWGLASVALNMPLIPVPGMISLQMKRSLVDAGQGVTRLLVGTGTSSTTVGLHLFKINGSVQDSRIYGGDSTSEAGVMQLAGDDVPANSLGAILQSDVDFQLINNVIVGGKEAPNNNTMARPL